MEVINLAHPIQQMDNDPHIMAVGFFDGIHLGHQELLNHAKDLANQNDVLFTVMTFSPHPDEIIKGEKDRKYIMPLSEKIERMQALGVDKLFVVEFDKAFASLPPENFIQHYILDMNTKHVVVGFDFTFGFKAKGNTQVLKEASENYSFGLSVIPKKTYLKKKISSTLIRELIHNGEIDLVPHYLGARYKVNVNIVPDNVNDTLVVFPIGNAMLPWSGTYYVEITDGEKVIPGEFRLDQGSVNELVINEQMEITDKTFKLEFLNEVSTARVVTV